ncbi:GntR family transcriptional regulator [Rhodobacteraceae bacterium W635]|uniref:GntR family transcriptional regulator n=1 Tax=Nioella halotolerans TaxID=2303578 RepID=UPI000E3DBC87|nr:GntR family transcriptional regulator [Rhodobacteraceae bacterium W635]
MTDITRHLGGGDWLSRAGGPRYLQLRKRIEEAIETGILPEGAALPSEREIGSLTGLSRVTVRKAIRALAEGGAVVQRQGSGSFVTGCAPRLQQSLSHLTSFSKDMRQRGMTVTSTWLERGVCLPTSEEIAALSLAEGDPVTRIARLRSADGRPMAIERAALPTDILPNPMIVETSLYEVLDRAGNSPVRAVQKISAINLPVEEAALLGVAAGAAGLRIQRVSYLPCDRVAEFTNSVYRGDAYDFVAELRQ